VAAPVRQLDAYPDAASVRRAILARYACRLHVALILGVCFVIGLLVTKALLMAGVHTMWIRYSLALVAAYLMFLLGVRIWLRLAGFDRPILPSRRRSLVPDAGLGDLGGSGGGGGGGSFRLPGFRGGGGGSGGGGATANFAGASVASDATPDSSGVALGSGGSSSSSHGGGGGFDLDFGDDGWVLLALIALVAAIFGGVVWLIYAAPTILADAAFAGLLSAGLVRSTRHITSGGWVSSVVGHTWFAFALVFVLALVFAVVAQHRFPDAHSVVDVLNRL
jgi:hypothetical protein